MYIIITKVELLSYKYLISKIAADKDGNKLGKIIRIDNLPGKTIKKMKPYLMILVKKRFRNETIVPIEAEKTIESKGSYVLLDMTKEEFEKELEIAKRMKLDRETYKGYQKFKKTKGGPISIGLDVSNLSHKSKERKR